MCHTVLKAETEQKKLHQIPAFKECALQRGKSTDNRQVKSKYLSGTINQMCNKEKIKQDNGMERDGKGANFIQGHQEKVLLRRHLGGILSAMWEQYIQVSGGGVLWAAGIT